MPASLSQLTATAARSTLRVKTERSEMARLGSEQRQLGLGVRAEHGIALKSCCEGKSSQRASGRAGKAATQLVWKAEWP